MELASDIFIDMMPHTDITLKYCVSKDLIYTFKQRINSNKKFLEELIDRQYTG